MSLWHSSKIVAQILQAWVGPGRTLDTGGAAQSAHLSRRQCASKIRAARLPSIVDIQPLKWAIVIRMASLRHISLATLVAVASGRYSYIFIYSNSKICIIKEGKLKPPRKPTSLLKTPFTLRCIAITYNCILLNYDFNIWKSSDKDDGVGCRIIIDSGWRNVSRIDWVEMVRWSWPGRDKKS